MVDSLGLRWIKADLHVHTPASKCYEQQQDAPEDLVHAALARGLEAIAITDHNSPEWIDNMRAAAEGTSLTVFPGVEISLREGYHLVALFAPGTSRDKVIAFLGRIGIPPDSYGKDGTMCAAGADSVLAAILEFGGLSLLAHIDSPKGAFTSQTKLNGERITVPQECSNFFNCARYDGVETISGSLPKGFDPDHHFKRFPSAWKVSDNPNPVNHTKHSKDGIGVKYTWLKMDEISLRGLRQCLLDKDTRICNDDERPRFQSPFIESIEITGGFFGGQTVHFSPGLNALIGAQGSGKSLILEFMRFGLDQLCSRDEIREDILGKLRKRLGSGGSVRIKVNRGGETYSVQRTLPDELPSQAGRCWDRLRESPTIVVGPNESTVEAGPDVLFPVHAYSQGEVVLVAREPGAQRRLIDETLDLSQVTAELERTKSQLIVNADSLALELSVSASVASITEKLAAKQEDIRRLSEKLNSEWFGRIEKWRALGKKAESHLSEISDLQNLIGTWQQIFKPSETGRNGGENTEDTGDEQSPAETEDQLSEIKEADVPLALVSSLATKSNSARELTIRRLADLSSDIALIEQEAAEVNSQWEENLSDTEAEYGDFLKTVGGDKEQLDAQLRRLRQQETALKRDLREAVQKEQRRVELIEARKTLLREFNDTRKSVSQLRRQHYNDVSSRTNGLLRITLDIDGDQSPYVNRVVQLLTGSAKRKSTIESLCGSLNPSELADMVLFSSPENVAESMTIEGVPRDTLEDILRHLRTHAAKRILELPYEHPCEDKPMISYMVDDRNYRDLGELSAGQQMTALQMIILSTGDQPVIIDQPEDSIDTTSVYQNIVQRLRAGKLRRQFILSSHNPNIVVTGDSDRISVLRASATSGRVTHSGAIDRDAVNKEAIEHLEGGPVAYGIRADKYGDAISTRDTLRR